MIYDTMTNNYNGGNPSMTFLINGQLLLHQVQAVNNASIKKSFCIYLHS